MYNLYTHIYNNPARCARLTCGESLFTMYTCGLDNKFDDLWSSQNYIIYVIEGRKIWHTPGGSYDLREGNCVFVRKGAAIVEQFLDSDFCLYFFFVPDEFICDVLKKKSSPLSKTEKHFDAVISIHNSETVNAFFHSMVPYFNPEHRPDKALIELKFRELILTLADNPKNGELLSYFYSLLRGPQASALQNVMEDNFCFNLKLEDFARLSSRSLSTFKRDFIKIYDCPPGKWLLEKRLLHALHLLTNLRKTVAAAAFETGFEDVSHFSRSFRQRFGSSPSAVKNVSPVLS